MTAPPVLSTASLLLALDLIGTFVFALSGAAAGVKSKLDLFGVGVLAFVAGNAGGVTRDVLSARCRRLRFPIGATSPCPCWPAR